MSDTWELSMPQRISLGVILVLFLTTSSMAVSAYGMETIPKSHQTFHIIMIILISLFLMAHTGLSVYDAGQQSN